MILQEGINTGVKLDAGVFYSRAARVKYDIISPLRNMWRMCLKLLPRKIIIVLMLFWLLIASTSFAGADKAHAQTENGIDITARAGLDGFCKSGTWLPIHVTVENTGTDVDARVQASYKNDANAQTIYGVDISLPATSRKDFFLYIHADGSIRDFKVSVMDGSKTLANKSLNVTCEFDRAFSIGIIADDPSTFNILNNIQPLAGTLHLVYLDTTDLPDQAQGWDALDTLILSNVDTGTLTNEQKQALELWLANGGKLFVTGGVQWQATAAGLGNILPIDLSTTKRVTSLSALATYIKDENPLTGETELATGQVGKNANVLVKQNGIPLLIEKEIGFGKVYYFAADPNLNPLKNWDGIAKLYSHLLGFKSPTPIWVKTSLNSYQINDALATLPELSIPSFIYICCWLGFYVAAIGPVNYLVLRRIKRTELAWLTVPVLVIFFTSLAYLSGYIYRGTRPVLNRIALAQGWEGVNQTQVKVVTGIYSPKRTTYTVETQDQFMLFPLSSDGVDLQRDGNWLSLKNAGGTNLPDLRVEIGGMQAVGTSGSMLDLSIQHDLFLTLGDQTPVLSGRITNTSGHTIYSAVLVTPSGWTPIGDLPPNKTAAVNSTLSNNINSTVTSPYSIISTLGLDIYSNSSEDADKKRRSLFFQATTASPSGYTLVNSGIYLMGWLDDIPASIRLQDQSSKAIDTMLYFKKLNPVVKTEGEKLMLTSSLYGWDSSLGDTIITSYYNIPNNGYIVRYQPSLPISFRKVDSLTLDIQTNATSDKVKLSLWNYQTETWDAIQLASYYTSDVVDAWQYVGTDGEIQMNINADPNDYVDITGINFTLMVQP
jgi:hypothetical protein